MSAMILIFVIFGANLVFISKVTSCKTKWPYFLGIPGRLTNLEINLTKVTIDEASCPKILT